MPKHKPLCKKHNHWMEAEHKKIFIDALNSDEFEQKPDFYINGTHDGKICACAIGTYVAKINKITLDKADDYSEDNQAELDFGWLSSDVNTCLVEDLINLNDNLGWTFKEIAEWVDEHIQVITPESHPLYFRHGEAIPNGH